MSSAPAGVLVPGRLTTFRPRLELLEDRIQLGDTLLGLTTVAVWGLGSASLEPWALERAAHDKEWRQGFPSGFDAVDFLRTDFLPNHFPSSGQKTTRRPAIIDLTTDAINRLADSILANDGDQAGQLTVYRLGGPDLPQSPLPVAEVGVSGGVGMPFSLFAFAATDNTGGRSLPVLLASEAASSSVGPVGLSFQASTGQLTVQAQAGEHTIREAPSSGGFVDVTIDGQSHSSNPASASFDRALAGATNATVAGIRIQGGGQETLILASQQHTGGFTVQAPGATVMTENVVTAGPLSIQAPNITVNGALQGSAVNLTAAEWLTINGAGRVDAEQPTSAGTIRIDAGVFVNTGQLHADGPAGGQISIAAGKILNAGPITADGTGPGGGGEVHIAFTDSYVATTAAVISATSADGPGGQLTIDGGGTGHLFSSGRHVATGSTGGAVDLFGQDIVLAGALVDTSGETAGGSVRIGSNLQGPNPVGDDTETVTVTTASTIRADASRTGGGGRVLLWANQSTAFDGTISARGGPAGGAGGFIDVSGQGDLRYGGSADAGAQSGKSGTMLLDPKNITISDAPAGVFPQYDLIDPHATAGGEFGDWVSALSNGDIVVTNPNDDFGGSKAGAAYLFDGQSGALISSLVGSHPGDQVGIGISNYLDVVSAIVLLASGNYVIESSNWNDNRGAVSWGNATTGVSGAVSDANSLVGSSSGDYLGATPRQGITGYDSGITPLSNGNYVVASPLWNSNRGAVTWGSGAAGVFGTISDANSLVGSTDGDEVGNGVYDLSVPGVTPLSNGNYVVDSPFWNQGRGAVTWGDGSTGVSGTVSDTNSLVGSHSGDYLGGWSPDGFVIGGLVTLSNGNYVVNSPYWNGARGAATWGSGTAGVSGIVSEANSLVGSNPGDYLGYTFPLSNGNYVVTSGSGVTWGNGNTGVTGTVSAANSLIGEGGYVTPLSNGNYLVSNPFWNDNRGAVTWGNGETGVSGIISASTSLVGNHAGSDPFDPRAMGPPGDLVGVGDVTALSNGNYVVASPLWNGARGAVTFGDGSTGVSGTVSDANSLVGSNADDMLGTSDQQYLNLGIMSLSNGNYVISSPFWNRNRGAVTWANGKTGISGTVSEANSLVGSNPNDEIGYAGFLMPSVTPLTNGNYVAVSSKWNGGRGAVTWGNGGTGVSGTVSDTNSLVGSNPGDAVGAGGYDPFTAGYNSVTPLSNGNYVVQSADWNDDRGAVTWGNGSTGTTGTVSDANSLVGSNPGRSTGDEVGFGDVIPLSNGNYVVNSVLWNGNRGAVTWGDGGAGVSGIVSDANSLVGSGADDGVGDYDVTPLTNGNYVVDSLNWSNNRGAVTWGNGSTGVSGTVSQSNSLVGSNPGDYVGGWNPTVGGFPFEFQGVTALSDGDYLVDSPFWNRKGAITWVSGVSGETLDGLGMITPQNSIAGSVVGLPVSKLIENPTDRTFLTAVSTPQGLRVVSGYTDPNQITYALAQSQSLSITPAFLTRTLNTGTAVILQASDDITVDSPITVNAGGKGGALTLQAGRSILLNASITTDNGALALIANDQAANGVVDSERDPGYAVISMAPGTSLNTGSGPLTVELRDGAGLTNPASGPITLQTVTAGSVSVVNNGSNGGSDVSLGSVTTTGVQSYADPNGTTLVTGDLTAASNPITFRDSVILGDGVSVDAGSSFAYFAGSGTQTLQSGNGSRFANVIHSGRGTLQLTSGLTVTGTLLQLAGTFATNDQPVTVGNETNISGGTFLAGTAPLNFSGGLVLASGTFTSSRAPMNLSGPMGILAGFFGGEGVVGPLTALGGTVAPGANGPGILSVSGPATLFSATTFRVICNGPTPGNDYSQLQASGPIALGGSTLNLILGFDPPLGSSFEILTNTGSTPINGTFNGLAEGGVFTEGGYQFQITYHGGTGGQSVVLTRL